MVKFLLFFANLITTKLQLSSAVIILDVYLIYADKYDRALFFF